MKLMFILDYQLPGQKCKLKKEEKKLGKQNKKKKKKPKLCFSYFDSTIIFHVCVGEDIYIF